MHEALATALAPRSDYSGKPLCRQRKILKSSRRMQCTQINELQQVLLESWVSSLQDGVDLSGRTSVASSKSTRKAYGSTPGSGGDEDMSRSRASSCTSRRKTEFSGFTSSWSVSAQISLRLQQQSATTTSRGKGQMEGGKRETQMAMQLLPAVRHHQVQSTSPKMSSQSNAAHNLQSLRPAHVSMAAVVSWESKRSRNRLMGLGFTPWEELWKNLHLLDLMPGETSESCRVSCPAMSNVIRSSRSCLLIPLCWEQTNPQRQKGTTATDDLTPWPPR